MDAKRREQLAGIGLLLLRLGAGGFMLTHGYSKLTGYEGLVESFIAKERDFLPLVGTEIEVALLIGAEFFCALAVVLGLFTRLACIPLIIAMGVAAFIAHGADPFGQKEKALLYLTMYSGLLFTGPGPLAIDAWIQLKLPWAKPAED